MAQDLDGKYLSKDTANKEGKGSASPATREMPIKPTVRNPPTRTAMISFKNGKQCCEEPSYTTGENFRKQFGGSSKS